MSHRRSTLVVLTVLALTTLPSCTHQQLQDMKNNTNKTLSLDGDIGYSQDDFTRGMMPRAEDVQNAAQQETSTVPDLAPVIAEDKKNILPQPLVSITVNQDVSLRDIFFELAKQAEVDLELDPTITGSIIFTAYNRPFDQVVERIADMAGLRYRFQNNVLRVERDTPYLKTYSLDYLSMTRNFSSSISSNTSAASSGGSSSSSGGSNGSTSTIASESKSDFWTELEANISQIIGTTNQQVNLTDQAAPVTTTMAIPAVSTEQLATLNNAAGTNGAAAPAQPAATTTTTTSTPPVAGLANPTGTQTAAAGATATTGSAAGATANPYFSFNKQGGLLNVFATEKQHRKIADYLERLHHTVSTQVLVEAKVFEVELNDENAAGIDWTAIYGNSKIGAVFDRPDFAKNTLAGTFSTGGQGSAFVYEGPHVSAVIDAISRYGTVRTLSSPRITVMNNQTAVLNVSESRVFFDLKVNKTDASSNGPATTDVTSTVKSVPEGVIIAVHPSVDMTTNEIVMNLRPSITRVVDTVKDPAVAYLNISGVENLVPELSVRELDSVVRMHSGETVIMGGLMQDRSSGEQTGVPVLSKTPIVGGLFRNNINGVKKTEMVVFLRARVVNSSAPEDADKKLYKEFGQNDRRPFAM